MASPPPYTSPVAPSTSAQKSNSTPEGPKKSLTKATFVYPFFKNISENEPTVSTVRAAITAKLPPQLTICAHKAPHDRGFFPEISYRKGWLEKPSETHRTFFRKSEVSKTACCDLCKATAWLGQNEYTGVLSLTVERSWDESVADEQSDRETWLKTTMRALWDAGVTGGTLRVYKDGLDQEASRVEGKKDWHVVTRGN